MIVERQIFYQGHVQGVGFRYTVKQIAAGYEIVGWVRNLADGRVELQVKGEEAEVTEFQAAVSAGQLKDYIRHTEHGNATLETGTNGFEIRC